MSLVSRYPERQRRQPKTKFPFVDCKGGGGGGVNVGEVSLVVSLRY
jgi:hypothetical protein